MFIYIYIFIEETLRFVAADLKDIAKVEAGARTRGTEWGEGAIARHCSFNVDRDDRGNSVCGGAWVEVIMQEMGFILNHVSRKVYQDVWGNSMGMKVP